MLIIELSSSQSTELKNTELSPNSSAKGVVIIDNIHDNDYNTALSRVKKALESDGYLVFYSSNYSDWKTALDTAHYLLMTAAYTDIPVDDITELKNWFMSGSRNLLLASRGDYKDVSYTSMNSLLETLGVKMRVQDDNVYTSDPNARKSWYVDTNEFNTADYPSLFTGVNNINFFSPSSVSYASTSNVMIYANTYSYQTDNNEILPKTIYDNDNDDKNGNAIPLAVYEEVAIGSDIDRVAVVGTTLWADFDYGDSSADDTVFVSNLLKQFTEKTIAATGDIIINLPDNNAPELSIAFPHNNAVLKGEVEITVDALDPFGVSSYEIYIDGELRSSKETYLWDTSLENDGAHKVKVIVKDPSDNSATIENDYVTYQKFEPFLPKEPKIMAYNIKESGIFAEWMDVVKEENPDILLLVETGDFDDNSNALLTKYTNELNTYFLDELSYESYTLQDIPTSWNGITLLSRFGVNNPKKIDTVILDSGAQANVPLPFLVAEIPFNSTNPLTLIGAHLSCCTDGFDNRVKEMEGILNYMDTLGDVPIIFLGDMNSLSPDDTSDTTGLGIEPIKMVIDKTNTKASKIHTFTDVHVKLNPSSPGYTFGGYSRIDYIFVNQHFTNKIISSTTGDTINALLGSDHVSVDVILDFSMWLTEPVFSFTSILIQTSTTTKVTSTTEESIVSIDDPVPFISQYFTLISLIFIVLVIKRKK